MLPDNLYAPVEGDQGARGIFSDQALSEGPQSWYLCHRQLATGITAGVALLGLAAIAGRRRGDRPLVLRLGSQRV